MDGSGRLSESCRLRSPRRVARDAPRFAPYGRRMVQQVVIARSPATGTGELSLRQSCNGKHAPDSVPDAEAKPGRRLGAFRQLSRWSRARAAGCEQMRSRPSGENGASKQRSRSRSTRKSTRWCARTASRVGLRGASNRPAARRSRGGADGRARVERGPQRLCGPTVVRLRTGGALRRPPSEDVPVLGSLTLERAYYHCDTCRAGVCPRDRAVARAKASGLLWELWPAAHPSRSSAPPMNAMWSNPHPAAPTMYPGAGRHRRAGAPLRGGGPARETARGSAGVKLVTANGSRPARQDGSPYASPGRSAQRRAGRPAGHRPGGAFACVYREAQRHGFDTAARRVVLGDGAAWIWRKRGSTPVRHRNRRYLPGSICGLPVGA